MLAWNQIDTVLLDMDGTLLDLHFDTHFWLEWLPQKLAERDGLSIQEADALIRAEMDRTAGTIDWYCLDHWARKLDMDMISAKREVQHLIAIRDDTLPFLDALHDSGRQVVLVTNAHPGSLSLKVERTQLDQHIDTLISTHEFGVTKESQSLWQKLQQHLGFNPARTLFVDDSLPILDAAQAFGIGHLLAVQNPDSKQPHRKVEKYPATADYRELLEAIRAAPIKV
ncbi:GMP/IMP nucleotidase YrfG [Saliniradius amylolyticus]|uniref:GMP/IMP nucleotidase YrfG n=2 Tax=Saliniradius amylolyticus TaxID=2183582 RepID=A0A2S2DYZ0_9ALTE|nr:GMP/IMP nucleotidase YrfG [Saliniradius amylolyticus]